MKISIITINYQNLEGLKKTVQSVKEQTYTDIEYIVIDGNSNDGTKEFLTSQDANIDYWVSEPDTGIYNAMNKGILKAKGNYLLFLNSGDFFVNENIIDTSLKLFSDKADIIYGDYLFNDGSTKTYPDKLTPLFFFKSSLPHQSTFIKRELFNTSGLYNESYRIAGDREFFTRCFFLRNVSFKHIELFITQFDIGGISSNKKFNQLKQKEDDIIITKFFGDFKDDYKYLVLLEHKTNRMSRNKIAYYFGLFKNYF